MQSETFSMCQIDFTKEENRCIGVFSISFELINNNKEALGLVFKDVIILECRQFLGKGCMEYKGISTKYFKPLQEGEMIPQYIFIFTTEQTEKGEICGIKIDAQRIS